MGGLNEGKEHRESGMKVRERAFVLTAFFRFVSSMDMCAFRRRTMERGEGREGRGERTSKVRLGTSEGCEYTIS